MSIRKRDGRWYVRIQHRGQRIERAVGSSATRQDALDYEAKLRRDIVADKLGRAPSRSIEDALVRWLSEDAARLRSYDNLVSKVRAIRAHCAGKSLRQIVSVADAVKSQGLREALAPATINRRLAILRCIANLAHDSWGWLDEPLGKKIKLLSGEHERHIYLTPDQVELLASCCEDQRVALAIRLAARTGLRESELLGAEAIFDGCIVVDKSRKGRGGRPRLVPVPADMPDLKLPLGIAYKDLRKDFEAARAKAGMAHVRFHDLRHTAASWWAASGANLAIIRDLLGHSTLAMTSRYTHLMTDDLKRVAEKVGGKTGGKKVTLESESQQSDE